MKKFNDTNWEKERHSLNYNPPISFKEIFEWQNEVDQFEVRPLRSPGGKPDDFIVEFRISQTAKQNPRTQTTVFAFGVTEFDNLIDHLLELRENFKKPLDN